MCMYAAHHFWHHCHHLGVALGRLRGDTPCKLSVKLVDED